MKNKGFTVIELIVVIIIIGLLTMFSIPAFRGLFAKSRLEESRNNIVAFYQAVHRYATASGVDYILEVDKSNATFRCMKDLPATEVRDSLRLGTGLSVNHAGAVSITFTFEPDGFVEDDDNIRRFAVYDTDTRDSLTFYISPLGVMEVVKK